MITKLSFEEVLIYSEESENYQINSDLHWRNFRLVDEMLDEVWTKKKKSWD